MHLMTTYYAKTRGSVIINELVDVRSIWCLRNELEQTDNRGWRKAVCRKTHKPPHK